MTFKPPESQELKAILSPLGYELDDAKAESLLGFLEPFIQTFQYLDAQDDELPTVRYPERSYRYPEAADNSLGAWSVRTEIQGTASGLLAGKRVAIKDNIFVAGVPLANGTDILEGFLPEFDATVVTRILDAGGQIEGKAVCEFLCASGASITATTGFVRNPQNPEYSTGGSSSGSAALVGSGAVDMALGCDQAGSIRIPASWSGVYGMKATHGLIPYTGILGMEATLDHVGPMTANVADNALMLEVLAGYDGHDSRQRQLEIHRYTDALDKPIDGMKIGIVAEGFGHPLSSAAVDECIRSASERFADLGAQTSEVSIPMHIEGLAVWGGIITEGLLHTLQTNGFGFNVDGVYSPSFVKAMRGWEAKLDQFPINVLTLILIGKYVERYGTEYYAKAKNLLARLRQAYDTALAQYDLLLLPTTVQQATKLPESEDAVPDEQLIADAFNIFNTCQFDVSGHPAMSIPCGTRNGLPVGMMLVGKRFDEPTIYRAASAFERTTDWREI